MLQETRNPTVRSYVIDRLASGGADAQGIEDLLVAGSDLPVRRAALLALGEFDEDGLPLRARERLTPRLVEMYRDDNDPGVHASAGWLLGRWGQKERLAEIDRSLAKGEPVGSRRWYVNSQGQTLVLIPAGKFQRGDGVGREQICVDHGFALAAREVTAAEFHSFRNDYIASHEFASTDDCPVHEVTWCDAAAYCNWLSRQDGIPEDRWCYLPNDKGQYAEGMKVAPDILARLGYRLPTVAEWEYACRAGSVTRWSIGEAEDLLGKYAWCVVNSSSHLHPVGTLRPNGLGLFDMHGNVWEYCQERAVGRAEEGTPPVLDVVINAGDRIARSGGFGHGLLSVQSQNDINVPATHRGADLGFRPARTVR